MKKEWIMKKEKGGIGVKWLSSNMCPLLLFKKENLLYKIIVRPACYYGKTKPKKLWKKQA